MCSLYSPRGAKVVFQEVEDGFIAFVEEIPGANIQGATLDEARENLQEAVELVLAGNRELARESIGFELGSLGRRQIASLVGLAPFAKDSGRKLALAAKKCSPKLVMLAGSPVSTAART